MSPSGSEARARLSGQALQVAILSDTHGTLDDRIQDLVTRCDLAVHGGDIGHADILARLQPRFGRVFAVLGNNDHPRLWPAHDQALLGRLPEVVEIALPGGCLIVIHGHQSGARDRHARLRSRFPDARAVAYGHSHRLALDTETTPWILNPGAAGRTRTYGGPSCLVLTASEAEWQVEVKRFPFVSAPRRPA